MPTGRSGGGGWAKARLPALLIAATLALALGACTRPGVVGRWTWSFETFLGTTSLALDIRADGTVTAESRTPPGASERGTVARYEGTWQLSGSDARRALTMDWRSGTLDGEPMMLAPGEERWSGPVVIEAEQLTWSPTIGDSTAPMGFRRTGK